MTWGGEPPAGAGDAQRAAPAGFQLVSPADWQAALRARRRRRTCRVIGCGKPAALCDRHPPDEAA